jgi:hypothetical protein
MSKLYVNEIASKTGSTTAMTIDSSGRVLQPALPAFRAYLQDAAWVDYTDGQILTFKNASTGDYFNQGGHFNENTYKFTCPVNGVYLFGFSLYVMENDSNGAFELYRNGSALSPDFKIQTGDNSTTDRTFSATWTLLCSSGDTIAVHCKSAMDVYGQFSQFHGHLVG